MPKRFGGSVGDDLWDLEIDPYEWGFTQLAAVLIKDVCTFQLKSILI